MRYENDFWCVRLGSMLPFFPHGKVGLKSKTSHLSVIDLAITPNLVKMI
eukprot:UN21355